MTTSDKANTDLTETSHYKTVSDTSNLTSDETITAHQTESNLGNTTFAWSDTTFFKTITATKKEHTFSQAVTANLSETNSDLTETTTDLHDKTCTVDLTELLPLTKWLSHT